METWLFCSSGARPLYLENIVRALALPAGDEIQYRYLDDIVCEEFKKAIARGTLVGKKVCLSYLDNRQEGITPRIFPVREAIIKSATRRGSSNIVKLKLARFIDASKTKDISAQLRKDALDNVTDWDSQKQKFAGNLVARIGQFDEKVLVAYDKKQSSHLRAFETTVDALTEGDDFKGGNLHDDWTELDRRIEGISLEIEKMSQQEEHCQRLMSVPGIGPIISTAMVAAIGKGEAFDRGRNFGALLGLVPRQCSTCGKAILGRLSKRGSYYLRTLFVHAAHIIMMRPKNWQKFRFGPWVTETAKRMHKNKVAAALANKLARIAWSILRNGNDFDTHRIEVTPI